MMQPRLLISPLRAMSPRLVLEIFHRASFATVQHSNTMTTNATGANPEKSQDDFENHAAVLRTYKPTSPGLRHLKRPVNNHLWKGRPFLPLTYPKKGQSRGGRNHSGKITVRHRGGGHKRRIRVVDYERWIPGPHIVERIEYDPNRSAHLALVIEQVTGIKSYILAPEGMRAGDIVQSYRAGLPQELLDSMGGIIDPGILAAKTAWRGNCLPLHMVPPGTTVFNIGNNPRFGGIFCRSAGTYGIVMSKDDAKKKQLEMQKAKLKKIRKTVKPAEEGRKEEWEDEGVQATKHKEAVLDSLDEDQWIHVKLQSGEVRKINKNSCCTIGVASNQHWHLRQLGKAGRSRWLGIRPTVRGVAMNKGKLLTFGLLNRILISIFIKISIW